MKNAEFVSNVFFRPILSAKYPPKKGAIIAPTASREPISASVSTVCAVPVGFSGPSDDRSGNIEELHPMHNAATTLERFTSIEWTT